MQECDSCTAFNTQIRANRRLPSLTVGELSCPHGVSAIKVAKVMFKAYICPCHVGIKTMGEMQICVIILSMCEHF